MVLDESSISTLHGIDERRKVLKEIVEIARTIEYLQYSLNAVLVLGDAEADLSVGANVWPHNLSDGLSAQPLNKIQQYYEKLLTKVSKDLQQILDYSNQLNCEPDRLTLNEEVIELVEQFRREAQTTVSLRILLKERGEVSKVAALSIPVDEIKAQLSELDSAELDQRKKIRLQICLMKEELKLMLASDAFSDAIKQTMQQALDGLLKDLKILDSNGSIELMQISFEEVIVSEDRLCTEENVQLVKSTPLIKKRRGFFRRLVYWVNSPWNVSWKDADKEERGESDD